MMGNRICIITHESIYHDNDKYFCDNLDLKSIPEGLSSNNDVKLIARGSSKPRSKSININNINISSNLFVYLGKILKDITKNKYKYLVISLTPYTFLSILILKLFRKKVFLYLRSDGFKEHEVILGKIGKLIYGLMFYIASNISSLIACREHLLKKKHGILVNPSHLNKKWFLNHIDPNLKEIKLLYVGRMRKEKGIFFLIDLLKNTDIKLNIVVSEKKLEKVYSDNIKIIPFQNYNDEIIKFYDESNILILPSYTEAHPQVVDEALARKRPVIVFNEIEHVKRDRKGIFVTNRDLNSLRKELDFIIQNYQSIQDDMKKNILPTKKDFLKKLDNILNS